MRRFLNIGMQFKHTWRDISHLAFLFKICRKTDPSSGQTASNSWHNFLIQNKQLVMFILQHGEATPMCEFKSRCSKSEVISQQSGIFLKNWNTLSVFSKLILLPLHPTHLFPLLPALVTKLPQVNVAVKINVLAFAEISSAGRRISPGGARHVRWRNFQDSQHLK